MVSKPPAQTIQQKKICCNFLLGTTKKKFPRLLYNYIYKPQFNDLPVIYKLNNPILF